MNDRNEATMESSADMLTTIAELHDEVAEDSRATSSEDDPHDRETSSTLAHLAAMLPQDD